MINIKMRFYKGDDDNAFVLQYCFEFKHEDGTSDWTDWETVPYVLGEHQSNPPS